MGKKTTQNTRTTYPYKWTVQPHLCWLSVDWVDHILPKNKSNILNRRPSNNANGSLFQVTVSAMVFKSKDSVDQPFACCMMGSLPKNTRFSIVDSMKVHRVPFKHTHFYKVFEGYEDSLQRKSNKWIYRWILLYPLLNQGFGRPLAQGANSSTAMHFFWGEGKFKIYKTGNAMQSTCPLQTAR